MKFHPFLVDYLGLNELLSHGEKIILLLFFIPSQYLNDTMESLKT